MDSAEAKPQGIHVSVTFEMIRLIIWQVCSAELQGFHVSVTLSNRVLKVSNCVSHGRDGPTLWRALDLDNKTIKNKKFTENSY